MKTISVSNLKSHLSAELKKVKSGETVVVLDHHHPVARVVPYTAEPLFIREASGPYSYRPLTPLTSVDPVEDLGEERSDRW